MRSLAGSVQDDELDQAIQFLETMPAWQVGQVVFADKKAKVRFASFRAQLFHGIDRIGGWWAVDFKARCCKALFVRGRGDEHFPAHRRAGRAKAGFMRRLGR